MSPNVIKNYDLLQKLNERGYKVQPIQNEETKRYDENLIVVNDWLCFMLPLDTSARILSSLILEETDFIITSQVKNNSKTYCIIPSDFILRKKVYYDVDYWKFENAWEFLEIKEIENE